MSRREAEAIVAADGVVKLDPAAFPPGSRVRVTAEAEDDTGPLSIQEVRRRLAGSVISYGDLMAPAMTDEEVEEMENNPIFPEDQQAE